jgi:hypothetical protein
MDNHGWISTDFMMASIVIIAIIISFIAIADQRMETVKTIEEMSDARVLVETIAETIVTVYSNGENCYTTIKMPPTVANETYSIKINSSGVYIRYRNMLGTAFIPPNIIPDIQSSNITMLPDENYNFSNVKDENQNNVVVIKKVG